MAAIDIIIPLYNKQATIEPAVRSVQLQTFADWRLIIVDDGSTDDGPRIVCQMREQDRRIELLSQSNAGPGAARNAGIRLATAPYLAFLDADDQWYPSHLETTLNAIQNHPAALVGTMYYEWPKQDNMARHWKRRGIVPGVYEMKPDTNSEQAESYMLFFHVGSCLVKTDSVRRHGGFYEAGCRLGEDTFFFAKLVFNERFMILGGIPTARFNRQESNLSNTYAFNVPPFLLDPDVLLRYCPVEMRELARKVLSRLALRTAYHKARNGYKAQAVNLLDLYPEAREFKKAYTQCRLAIRFSWILPYWIKIKCRVGPPVRLALKKIAYCLKWTQRPPEI